MTEYELVSVAVATGERLDSQWAIFISVHLALLGAIVYVDRPLRRLEKIGASLIYAAFAVFNYRLIISLRDLLERCALELSEANPDLTDNVTEYFSDLSHSGHFAQAESTITALHIIAFAIVIAAVVFDGALKARSI